MGQSTDAILFYGLCWDEEGRIESLWTSQDSEGYSEDEDDRGSEESWENRYALLQYGIKHPEEEYSETVSEIYSKYWKDVDEAVKKAGVEIGTHCSCECPMPYVAIKKSMTVANRGGPEEIKSLRTQGDWDNQLGEFCEVMGIRIEGMRVGWWLVSDWC